MLPCGGVRSKNPRTLKALGRHAAKSPGEPGNVKSRTKAKGDENAFAAWVQSMLDMVAEKAQPKVGQKLTF